VFASAFLVAPADLRKDATAPLSANQGLFSLFSFQLGSCQQAADAAFSSPYREGGKHFVVQLLCFARPCAEALSACEVCLNLRQVLGAVSELQLR